MTDLRTELPRADWRRALDEFTALHQGWLVTVHVSAPEFGGHEEIVDLPLAGVFFEVGYTATLSIAAGFEGRHAVHVIEQPQHLWITRLDGRIDKAIEIDAIDGSQTVVRLKHPVLPETVDGLP